MKLRRAVQVLVFVAFFAIAPTSYAQFLDSSRYAKPEYGYSVVPPTNWKTFPFEYTALKGGTAHRLYITQDTDIVSRTTKSFVMRTGSIESIYNVSKKVVSKVSKEQLVDLYIDQLINTLVDLVITGTRTKGTGDEKVYILEVNYAVPGYREYATYYFQFKNGKAFIWSTHYLNTFSNFASTLQGIADSVRIQ